jgi:A/G-specific adenine glycosylase
MKLSIGASADSRYDDPVCLNRRKILCFQNTIYKYYHLHVRHFPWRETIDPYHILVSEFMLQQTQTKRVLNYFHPFLNLFPKISILAEARQQDVLAAWQGLGYNRRALNLQQTAKKIVAEYGGEIPSAMEDLMNLPGIGRSTAGAVMAFGFEKPAAFVETNIRRVFLQFFFQEKSGVKDTEILPLIEKTLDRDDPRHWYYALMDYGAMLKSTGPNPNTKSAHYARQAIFEGSDRQARGIIIRALLENKELSRKEVLDLLGMETARARKIVQALKQEGFLVCSKDVIRLL